MGKKLDASFDAELSLTTDKGGAWLAEIRAWTPGDAPNEIIIRTAWKTLSAAKRWVKSEVLEHTPRKSIKLVIKDVSAEDKPIRLEGRIDYKVEA